MNKKLESALNETMNLIEEKKKEYANVKGMKPLVEYAETCAVNILLRVQTNTLDEDWLKAVQSDIRRVEYKSKYEAGLLSPEETAARKALLDFFNSKPDLPDYVK